MKFNWGTGILTFIIIFLLACATFIVFTMRQGVNLVHEDYYRKGTDHSEQMRINQRSARYKEALKIINLEKYLVVDINDNLSSNIDSGKVVLFRPSDSKKDITMPIEQNSTKITFQKEDLLHGRYILKFHWYSGGTKFEINRPVNVE